jgi:hypothetical protein
MLKLLLCKTNLRHQWHVETTEDGGRYRRCTRCGKYDDGGGGQALGTSGPGLTNVRHANTAASRQREAGTRRRAAYANNAVVATVARYPANTISAMPAQK